MIRTLRSITGLRQIRRGGGCGAGTSNSNTLRVFLPFGTGTAYSDQYDITNGRVNTAGAISTSFGFLVATRISSSSHAIYRNGSSLISNATSGGSLTATAIYIHAYNNNGVAESWMSSPLASYRVGSGLTAANATDDNADEQAFQTALGRNV